MLDSSTYSVLKEKLFSLFFLTNFFTASGLTHMQRQCFFIWSHIRKRFFTVRVGGTGTGCPEKWLLCPWKCSRLGWVGPWTTCLEETGWSLRFLNNSMILWSSNGTIGIHSFSKEMLQYWLRSSNGTLDSTTSVPQLLLQNLADRYCFPLVLSGQPPMLFKWYLHHLIPSNSEQN